MFEAKQFKQLVQDWAEEQRYLIYQRKLRIYYARSGSQSGEGLQIALARENLLLRAKRVGVRESDFERIKEIGRGAFSTVYLVRKKSTRNIYAMKIIAKEKVAYEVDGVRLRTERAVMLNFQSPFIVKLHYAFQDAESLFFIMDYAAGSDISKLLDNCGSLPVSWARIWFAQMLCSVLILHGTDPLASLGVDKSTLYRTLDIEIKSLKSLSYDFGIMCSRSNSVCSVYHEESVLPCKETRSKLGTSLLLEDDSSLVVSLSNSSHELTDPKEATDNSDASNLLLSHFKIHASPQLDSVSFFDYYREFIHRDLKPQNFLLTAEGHIMLADFGFAKELQCPGLNDTQALKNSKSIYFNHADKCEQTIVGTLNYISPEYFQSGMYGKCVDYWALGCILYEMLTGEQAISGSSEEVIVRHLSTLSYEELLPPRDNIDDDAWDLICGLLRSPEYRYGRSYNLLQLLQHKFFTLGIPIEDIIGVYDEELRRALSGEEVDYDKLPILPLPELLIRIPMPWRPVLENEEDLYYFARSNLFDAKQIVFSENSPLSSYFSSNVSYELFNYLNHRNVCEALPTSPPNEGDAVPANLSHESSMSYSVLDVRKCAEHFMEKIIPSPRSKTQMYLPRNAPEKFTGIDYTAEDELHSPRFPRIEDYFDETGQ